MAKRYGSSGFLVGGTGPRAGKQATALEDRRSMECRLGRTRADGGKVARSRPAPCNNALLVELRPILHVHLHPQTLKRFHLRFHLGRVDHPERVK